MKNLNFEGVTYLYSRGFNSIYNSHGYTNFYSSTETEIETSKKYFFFGEEITKTIPKYLFTIWIDIEDTAYTKDDIRNRIKRELKLLKRGEEIENGEIV